MHVLKNIVRAAWQTACAVAYFTIVWVLVVVAVISIVELFRPSYDRQAILDLPSSQQIIEPVAPAPEEYSTPEADIRFTEWRRLEVYDG